MFGKGLAISLAGHLAFYSIGYLASAQTADTNNHEKTEPAIEAPPSHEPSAIEQDLLSIASVNNIPEPLDIVNGRNLRHLPLEVVLAGVEPTTVGRGMLIHIENADDPSTPEAEFHAYVAMPYHIMESQQRHELVTSQNYDFGISQTIAFYSVRLLTDEIFELDRSYWCMEPRWDLAIYRFEFDDQDLIEGPIEFEYARLYRGDNLEILRAGKSNVHTTLTEFSDYQTVNDGDVSLRVERVFRTRSYQTVAGDSGGIIVKYDPNTDQVQLAGMLYSGTPREDPETGEADNSRHNPWFSRGRNIDHLMNICLRTPLQTD